MRTSLRPLVAVVLVLLLAACGPPSVGGSIAATVAGEPIERDLLERMVRAQLQTRGIEAEALDAADRSEEVGEVQRQMLTALIQFEILAHIADDLDVEIAADELDESFEEQVQQFGGVEAFEDETGLTEDEFRDLLVATQLRVDRIMESLTEDVSEEDLREAYDAQAETRYATRTVRHILVETEDEADDIVDELDDGADFGELAGEHSEDPGSGARGGELQPAPRGQFVPEFDEAVWEAEIGELVGPVETQHGFHVLEVLEDDVAEFDEVRDELEQELAGGEVQGTFQAIVESAFQDIDVDIDPAYGHWDPGEGIVMAEEPIGPDQQPEEEEIPDELREQFPEGEVPEELREDLEELERQLEEQGDAGTPGQ